MKQYFILFACRCFLMICLHAAQALPSANAFAGLTYNVTVSPSEAWIDTAIELHPGDALQINAVAGKEGCSPNGTKVSQTRSLPLNSAPPGALIGKLGENGAPFLVGSKKDLKIEQRERLYFRLNANAPLLCTGGIEVKLQLPLATATTQSKLAAALQTWLTGQFGIAPAEPSTDISPAVRSIEVLGAPSLPLDTELCSRLDSLPRRVKDQFNTPGDMVNFVIVGSQQLQGAFQAAGWRLADKSIKEGLINVVLVTYEGKDYLEMPMSTLFLFNRPQDFGYEQAEAYSVVASRHHFRLWKAPFLWNGQAVWVGAGTHDVGFEKDQRSGKVTHKIDPIVDREREYISQTLDSAGMIKRMNHYLPTNPVHEARNATGGSYRSDGRLLVIFLR
jgi:LssY C-terminus